MIYRLLILILIISTACSKSETIPFTVPDNQNKVLDFVVAGHTYGNPDTYTESIYPPFYKLLKTYSTAITPDFIFLTGDVVAHQTEKNWTTVKREMDSLKIPWFIAPGNHDLGEFMLNNIQSEPYFIKEKDNNLMLILNTCNAGWSTDSAQTLFIENALNKFPNSCKLFVFTHQLWWLKNIPPAMDLDSIRPNSYAAYDGDNDFWRSGYRPIKKFNAPTYFFAGDVGSYYGLIGYYEEEYENFKFYGSGMGGAVEDNFLYVSVYKDGSVQITRVDF